MQLGYLHIRFHLSGCFSLKDKRRRLRGLRDRLGRKPHLAVSECGSQDSLQEAEWLFAAVGSNQNAVDRALERVIDHLEDTVDAEMVQIIREDVL